MAGDGEATIPPKPTDGGGGRLTPRQYGAATAALYLSSLTSGATSMVLLLSSLRAGHSVWQTSIIFASYQAASAVAAVGAGGALGAVGLRPVLTAAFLLQAAATAALVPLRARERAGPGNGVAWPLATATAYASAINAVIGVSRVLARTASKALPKLASGGRADGQGEAAADETSPPAARLLMLRTALVTGGRTTLKGAGSLLGGGLEQGLGYVPAIALLAAATLPAAGVALLSIPAGAGKAATPAATAASGRRAWGRPAAPAAPVAVVTAAQALQNAAQFGWLQVPLPHLLASRGAAFRYSRTATGGAVAAVLVYEGAQQLVVPRGLRWLRQAPPRTTPAVVGVWGVLAAVGAAPLIALCAASAGAGPAGALGAAARTAPASAAFFAALWANVAPTQVFAVLLSFTLQAVMDRGRVAATAGMNTAAQAAGRAAGVLASGALYGGMTGDWGGHRRPPADGGAGRPDDSEGPVGPFAATMALTAGLAALSAAVAWAGLPAPAPGAPRGVACGPGVGCCGAGRGRGEEGGVAGGRA